MAKRNSKQEEYIRTIIAATVPYINKYSVPLVVDNVPGKALQLENE